MMGILAAAGCQKPAPVALPPPADLPEINLSSPQETARSFLKLLQTELRATAHQDKETSERCVASLEDVVSAKTLSARLARLPQFKVVVGDDPIKGYVENWGAAVAYYAEGLHFEQMRCGVQTPTNATVVVPASGPDDETLIQVSCVPEDDGCWRVAGIDFVTALPASQPASAPSSAATSQPA